MTPSDPGTRLGELLDRLGAAGSPPADPWEHGRPDGADPLLWHLVFSFMAWEAGPACAVVANCRLHRAVVDYNELRVCLPDELVQIIGPDYPMARERCLRLRTTLNDLFRREQCVTLAHQVAMGRREARLYLESLDGMPLFVAARVSLLSLDAHAFPVDERLRGALALEGAVPADLDVVGATGWLERFFRAGEAAAAYMHLEGWLSQRPANEEDATRRIPGS